jgi:uncharacterized membrane protein YwaF
MMMNMLWGTFGITHILTLLLSILIIVCIYFILRNKSEKTQIITLFVLSLRGLCAIIYNLIAWKSPLEYLPLHMCSINAIMLPIAILTKHKTIGNLLILWALGALIALLLNYQAANYELLSWTFVMYYFPHTLEFGIPILLFIFKIIKLDYKTIPSTIIITFVIYTLVHFVNVGLNNYFINNNILDWEGNVIQVNYMFSFSPENPVLQLFYNLIPYKYFYMLLAFPIIVIYELLVYLPSILKARKEIKLNLALE